MPSESPLVTYRPNLDDPIGYLNRPVDSQYGFFVFPRAYPLRFREGSTINVSWNTQFDAVNLYFYQIGKVANSVQITTNLAANWYQWEVTTKANNLTVPFVFRAVNAYADSADALFGGFWSVRYFIIREEEPAPSLTQPGSDRAITPPANSSSKITLSITDSIITSPFTLQSSSISCNEAPVSSSYQVDPRLSHEPIKAVSQNGASRGTVIGLSVGLSVTIIAAVIGATLLYRRKRRRKDTAKDANNEVRSEDQDNTVSAHEIYTEPAELPCA